MTVKERLLKLSLQDRFIARAAVALVQAAKADGGTPIRWSDEELADFAANYAAEFMEHFDYCAADDIDGVRGIVRAKVL